MALALSGSVCVEGGGAGAVEGALPYQEEVNPVATPFGVHREHEYGGGKRFVRHAPHR